MNARNTFISFIGLGSRTSVPALYQYLKLHPALILPDEPTNFFRDANVYAKGIAWYQSQFSEAREGVRAELALDYLSQAQSAGLIARTYPSAKLLAVIDNPLLSVRIEYVTAIQSKAISRQVSLAQFLKEHPEILLRARYGRQLVNYFSLYSHNDLLVLVAKDLQDDPLKSLYKVYNHLGLDSSFVPVALRHLVVVEEDEKKRPGLIKRSLIGLRHGIKAVINRIKLKVVTIKKVELTVVEIAKQVSMSAELRQFLVDYYRDDVKQLSSLLHRDFIVEWGFDRPV